MANEIMKDTQVTRADIIAEELWEELLCEKFKTKEGLSRYIKIISTRLVQLKAKGEDEYYIVDDEANAVINTGLMDKYTNDIRLLYRYYKDTNTYSVVKRISSKQDIIQCGFSKEQAAKDIKPICFFDEEEAAFSPSIVDFDINHKNLEHIISNNINRFPENIREIPAEKIADLVLRALERGVKMQQRDRSFAKRTYNGKEGTIAYYLPLHINAPFMEDPELVMVITKPEFALFYQVVTVLEYSDEIKDRATVCSLFSNVW